jgi:hypothetical protein
MIGNATLGCSCEGASRDRRVIETKTTFTRSLNVPGGTPCMRQLLTRTHHPSRCPPRRRGPRCRRPAHSAIHDPPANLQRHRYGYSFTREPSAGGDRSPNVHAEAGTNSSAPLSTSTPMTQIGVKLLDPNPRQRRVEKISVLSLPAAGHNPRVAVALPDAQLPEERLDGLR